MCLKQTHKYLQMPADTFDIPGHKRPIEIEQKSKKYDTAVVYGISIVEA